MPTSLIPPAVNGTEQRLDAILAELREVARLLVQPAATTDTPPPPTLPVQAVPASDPQPARRGPGRPRKVA